MATLIKNIGILDARKAKIERILEITKIMNVGVLAVSPENRAELARISMLNVGSILELEEGYKFQTGTMVMNKAMLENAQDGIRLCLVGQLTVDADISPELLQQKLLGFYLVGQASVPEHLYGTFMSCVKEVTGVVSPESGSGKKSMGKIKLTNDYLKELEDATELSVMGVVTLDEELDEALFRQKIARLKVMGAVKCLDTQESMVRGVLVESETTQLRVIRKDCLYLPSGTKLDAFALMSATKPMICCQGQLILGEDVDAELLGSSGKSFEAGVLYFPRSVMREMIPLLSGETAGLPYEPGKLAVVTGEQHMTAARLESMPDDSTLVVIGVLKLDEDIPLELISAKIAMVDNYGEIIASRDTSSILQGKLRRDEGHICSAKKDEDDIDESEYDNVIANAGTYTL